MCGDQAQLHCQRHGIRLWDVELIRLLLLDKLCNYEHHNCLSGLFCLQKRTRHKLGCVSLCRLLQVTASGNLLTYYFSSRSSQYVFPKFCPNSLPSCKFILMCLSLSCYLCISIHYSVLPDSLQHSSRTAFHIFNVYTFKL